MSRWLQILKWGWRNLELILAILAAAITTALGAFGSLAESDITTVTLSVLTLLAIGQLRSAEGRIAIRSLVQRIADQTGPKLTDRLVSRGMDEKPILASTHQELWLVQETGNLIAETMKPEIRAILSRGGQVNAVFASPTPSVARLIAARNPNLSVDGILNRARLAREHIANLLATSSNSSSRLTVRYTPNPMSSTLVVSDPNAPDPRNRRAVVTSMGFRTPFAEKISLDICGDQAPELFRHFTEEAKRQFFYASKVVLLTGPPSSGKSTILQNAIQNTLRNSDELYYVVSPEIRREEKRIGFEFQTSTSSNSVKFAERNFEGGYDLIPNTWTRVVTECAHALADGKVLIIDEIGPLQLREPNFKALVQSIVQDSSASLIASVATPNHGQGPLADFLDELLKHPRSTVLHVTNEGDRTRLPHLLQQEISSALDLYRMIPRNLWT